MSKTYQTAEEINKVVRETVLSILSKKSERFQIFLME